FEGAQVFETVVPRNVTTFRRNPEKVNVAVVARKDVKHFGFWVCSNDGFLAAWALLCCTQGYLEEEFHAHARSEVSASTIDSYCRGCCAHTHPRLRWRR